MNETAAVEAVYTVIEAQKEILVQDLIQDGAQREIRELVSSVIPEGLSSYVISIDCLRVVESTRPSGNVISGAPQTEIYTIVVDVVDVPIILAEDPEGRPYKTSHDHFRLLIARLVKLLRKDTNFFPSQTASPRFTMAVNRTEGDRRVEVRNQHRTQRETISAHYGRLQTRLTFQLVGCSDDSLLYL
jgi:hypothetical protein